ncbi:MAG: ArsR family transcriptional regulator [Actinomyces sp.]|nr:MAG: ArsR family transcriptional regulator [Actinomyces sp.]
MPAPPAASDAGETPASGSGVGDEVCATPPAPEAVAVPDDATLATLAKALGHPARVAILRVLAERDACVTGELVAEFPLAQSTVSEHLRILREAGLVRGEIEGPRTRYCIDRSGLAALRAGLDSL